MFTCTGAQFTPGFAMIAPEQKFAALLRLHPHAATRFLADAVEHAAPDELFQLMQHLAARPDPAAHLCVARHLHRLGSKSKAITIATPRSVNQGARTALQDRSGQTILNTIQLIHDRADSELIDLVPAWLSMDPKIAEQAATTLLSTTTHHIGPTGRRDCALVVRERLEKACIRAAGSFRPQQGNTVVLALSLLTVRPGTVLRSWLDGGDDAGHRSLRQVARAVDDPLVRRNLISWLGVPALASAAARNLDRLTGVDSFVELLESTHLLRSPARRRAIRRVSRPLRCLPDERTRRNLPAETMRSLPEYMNHLDLKASTRASLLTTAATWKDAAARRFALRQLGCLDRVVTVDHLRPFCHDSSPAVAADAALRTRLTFGRAALDDDLFAQLAAGTNSPRWTRAISASRSPHALFRLASQLTSAEVFVAARRLHNDQPNELIQTLRNQLASKDRNNRTLAVRITARLHLSMKVELELIALAVGRDARTAAACITLLGKVDSPSAAEAVRVALRHPDTRVAANAIEALASAGSADSLALVEPLMCHHAARIRANAILTFIERGDTGPEVLERMLHDRRAAHRSSAAWAAGALQVRTLLPDLDQLAEHDTSHVVRCRARAAAGSIDRARPIAQSTRTEC